MKKELVAGKFGLLRQAVAGMVATYFYQDKKGRIWIGTNSGLFLHEQGTNTGTRLQHVEGDASSLPSSSVKNIAEDSSGNIWIGTDKGLARLTPNSKRLTTFSRKQGSPRLSNDFINAVACDARNKLWIGTDEGIDVFDLKNNTVTNYVPDIRNTASISSRSIRSVLFNPKGIYWIGTFRGGLNKYDKNFNHFNLREYNAFDPHGLRAHIVTAFAETAKGVFVGTDGGGLQLYNPSTGFHPYQVQTG